MTFNLTASSFALAGKVLQYGDSFSIQNAAGIQLYNEALSQLKLSLPHPTSSDQFLYLQFKTILTRFFTSIHTNTATHHHCLENGFLRHPVPDSLVHHDY